MKQPYLIGWRLASDWWRWSGSGEVEERQWRWRSVAAESSSKKAENVIRETRWRPADETAKRRSLVEAIVALKINYQANIEEVTWSLIQYILWKYLMYAMANGVWNINIENNVINNLSWRRLKRRIGGGENRRNGGGGGGGWLGGGGGGVSSVRNDWLISGSEANA